MVGLEGRVRALHSHLIPLVHIVPDQGLEKVSQSGKINYKEPVFTNLDAPINGNSYARNGQLFARYSLKQKVRRPFQDLFLSARITKDLWDLYLGDDRGNLPFL